MNTSDPNAHRWTESGEMQHDAGDMGGDVQAGRAYSRRFLHNTLPGRVIDVAAYPIIGDGTTPDVKDGEIRLQVQVALTVCTDTSDPGGTEVWAENVYAIPDKAEYDRVYETVAEAEHAAGSYISNLDASASVSWDGYPSCAMPEERSMADARSRTYTLDLPGGNGTPFRFVYFPQENRIRYYDRRYPLKPGAPGYGINHSNENGQSCGGALLVDSFLGQHVGIRGWHEVDSWDIDAVTVRLVGSWIAHLKERSGL